MDSTGNERRQCWTCKGSFEEGEYYSPKCQSCIACNKTQAKDLREKRKERFFKWLDGRPCHFCNDPIATSMAPKDIKVGVSFKHYYVGNKKFNYMAKISVPCCRKCVWKRMKVSKYLRIEKGE